MGTQVDVFPSALRPQSAMPKLSCPIPPCLICSVFSHALLPQKLEVAEQQHRRLSSKEAVAAREANSALSQLPRTFSRLQRIFGYQVRLQGDGSSAFGALRGRHGTSVLCSQAAETLCSTAAGCHRPPACTHLSISPSPPYPQGPNALKLRDVVLRIKQGAETTSEAQIEAQLRTLAQHAPEYLSLKPYGACGTPALWVNRSANANAVMARLKEAAEDGSRRSSVSGL